MYPLQGSLLGGTYLTITGSGFGTNDSNVLVDIGPVKCDVRSLLATQIICEIDDAGTVHHITNRGVDPGKKGMLKYIRDTRRYILFSIFRNKSFRLEESTGPSMTSASAFLDKSFV